MASVVPNDIVRRAFDDLIDGATIKLLLLDASAAADKTAVFVSEVTADELTDGSYARQTVTSAAVSIVNVGGNWYIKIDADDSLFNNLDNETAGMGVYFIEVTNDADSPILAFVDAPDQVADGDPIEFRPDALGILRFNNGAV